MSQPVKPDEMALRAAVLADRKSQPHTSGTFLDELAQGLGIPDSRSYYIGSKWTDKGWWDYGVSLRSGWLTPKGIEAMAADPAGGDE